MASLPLSETSPVASFNHPDRASKPGSIGTPIQGVEMRVVDNEGAELPVGQIGEIVIRGHNVMKGYWRNPGATAETITDGWLKTGDLARVDEDGYFYIVDRKKDLIQRVPARDRRGPLRTSSRSRSRRHRNPG